MKISKSLLQNIAVGLLVAGSITSCEVDEPLELHDESCPKNCEVDHTEPTENTDTPGDWGDYCLACGMG